MSSAERGLRQVPVLVLSGFIVMICLQLTYHHLFKSTASDGYRYLQMPRPVDFYRSMALGSDKLVSYLLLLKLQLHDSQGGRHLNYVHLDYDKVDAWLQTIYELNPRSDYPAFLASRVYSQVQDRDKVRVMVALIERLFDIDPEQHWRRMTEACLLAKHQLQDLPLALRLAKKIAALPDELDLPFWARDMQLVLLDELGELESAQLLVSSMLQSGRINDPDELRFLRMRLLKIQQGLLENEQNR